MSRRSVVVMPGDGIGNVVLPESLRVLEAAGFEADWINADLVWQFWRSHGNPLPQRNLYLIPEHKVPLIGPITYTPNDAPAAELPPELRDRAQHYYSPHDGLTQT